MTSPDTGSEGGGAAAGALDRVGELLQERERYDQWLAGLEARKANTPPHVYDRVRADYERRRGLVLGEIAAHASELRDALGAARARHAAIEREESQRRDERAEAELRYEVGEYSETQWKELSAVGDAELGQLAEEREAARRELDRLEEVVRQATPAASTAAVPEPAPAPATASPEAPAPPVPSMAAAAPDAAPVEAPAVADDAGPSDAPAPAALAASDRAAGATRASSDFDELAFLKSVVGRPSNPPAAQPMAAGQSNGAPASPPASAPAPVPEPVPQAAAQPATRPAAPPEPEPAAAVDRAPRFSTPVGQMPLQPPPAPRATTGTRQVPTPPRGVPSTSMSEREQLRRVTRESGKVPSFLRDVPIEQVKTLKCQECGTMNYPTEWYCERCGGELAAM